jgi:hypothetical protein
MGVLLRSTKTRNYVRGPAAWTAIAEHALYFEGIVPALDYALAHGLSDVQPVIRCSNSSLDVRLAALSPVQSGS